MFKYNPLLCSFSLQLIFFSEKPFHGNYSTLDSHINTVISHMFAYSSRWRAKTVARSISKVFNYMSLICVYSSNLSRTTEKQWKRKKKRIEGISVDVANCNDCWNLSSLEIWGEWNRGKDAWGRAGAVKSNTRKIPQK